MKTIISVISFIGMALSIICLGITNLVAIAKFIYLTFKTDLTFSAILTNVGIFWIGWVVVFIVAVVVLFVIYYMMSVK